MTGKANQGCDDWKYAKTRDHHRILGPNHSFSPNHLLNMALAHRKTREKRKRSGALKSAEVNVAFLMNSIIWVPGSKVQILTSKANSFSELPIPDGSVYVTKSRMGSDKANAINAFVAAVLEHR